ncbi:MBOAT family O-acyltransferase [Spirosoma rigui]|uniref:MBOAT family O-acyltransferase n=1 Tax=Spirosoma rigui TaxID=564064 RepID=UPI0009B17D65|nr:MBOAT family O-acyltransferase [Spirosoma rigui]
MLFNSLHFLLFFFFTTFAYYSLPPRRRWMLLLIVSCYFYMAFILAYIAILGVVILIDYVAGLYIERAHGSRRRLLLIISLVANIGLLAFFKYYDFFNEQLTALLSGLSMQNPIPMLGDILPGIVLPIGLSFHTFQSISYTIEVYRGKQQAEKKLGVYALYVLFYPQLVAGPIERPQNMLHQFHEYHPFNWSQVRYGLLLIAGGFFKKVVIADRMALVVDPAFGNAGSTNGSTLLLAAVFYSIQIYCDFSGYTDIAIGAGQVLGIKMMRNFDTPYLSASIAEFWRRWHISLSTWFRDYVYIPLGGNRKSVARTYLNTFTVFGLSGLWHGADWKFIIWGLLHGFYLVIGQMWSQRSSSRFVAMTEKSVVGGMPAYRINQLLTFALVTFTWVFFRAASTSDAFLILGKIASVNDYLPVQTMIEPAEIAFCTLLIGLLVVEPRWIRFTERVTNRDFWVAMVLLLSVCYFFGVFTANQFIYFQF